MERQIFTEEHDAFRDMVRAFIAKEITPYHAQWEREGIVSRDVWLAAGRAGLLGIHLEEKYGGGGQPDYRFYVVLNEELARAGASGPMFQLRCCRCLMITPSAYVAGNRGLPGCARRYAWPSGRRFPSRAR
jgi:alkylation response protein AidB-like acyl-CoA dehydrogenase